METGDPNPQSPTAAPPEQRFATALFVDLVGSTALAEQIGDDAAYLLVTDVLKLLDAATVEHGGTIEQFQGDGMLCVFGATVALESAARAAVNAAIVMRQRVQRYNEQRKPPVSLRVRIGVNTGRLLRGDPMRPGIQNLRVYGDVVNTSARLQKAASPGQIYVGRETQRITRDDLEYRDLGVLPAKGKAEGVHAFELLAQTVSPQPKVRSTGRLHSELVGRARELARLERAVGRVASGKGGVVALIGEAGLGKSRLVHELRYGPAARGVLWLEARSIALGRTHRLHTFVDLLERITGLDPRDDAATFAHKLEPVLANLPGDEVRDALALLSRVMGQHVEETADGSPMQATGAALESLLIRTVRHLLTALAGSRPLVIELEDVHWADASSVELLRALFPLAAERPFLFLLVCRPHFDDTSEALRRTLRSKLEGAYEEVAIEQLDTHSTNTLLGNLLRMDNVPPDLVRAVGDKAEGNPFFLEQLVRVLLDQGLLTEGADGFSPTDRIKGIAVPGTIEEVVVSRIELLPPAHQRIVQIAAVIGRPFPNSVIAELLSDKDELAENLAHLCEVQILDRWDRADEWGYELRHPIIQEVAYGGLFPSQREEIHRQVARAIELHLTHNAPGYEGMLAWHYSMGQEEARAEEHLLAAGEEAARLGASNEALVLFRQAADRYFERHPDGGDAARRLDLHRKVARAHFNRGQFLEAVEHLNRALELLGERSAGGRLDAARRAARTLATVLARLYLPQPRSRRPATEVERTIIELMFDRARAQTTTSPTRFVLDSMDTLRRLWQVDARSVPQAGGMYAGSVGIFSYGGLSFGLSSRLLAVARPLVRTDDTREHFVYRFMNFLHHHLAGDWSETHLIDENLVARALSIGQLWDVVNYLNLLAERAMHCGDQALAEQTLRRLSDIEHEYGYELAKSALTARRIHAAVLRDELEEALRCVDSYLSEHPEEQLQVLGFGERALVLLRAGQRDSAARALARGHEILRKRSLMPPFHRLRLLRAQLAYDLDALESMVGVRAEERRRRVSCARRSVRAAVREAAHVAALRSDVGRMAGAVEWIIGRRQRAVRLWSAAFEDARRRGARLDLALLHGEVARRLGSEASRNTRVDGLLGEQHAERAAVLRSEIGFLGRGAAPSEATARS